MPDDDLTPHENWRSPPHVQRAASFKFAFCGDPDCGLHLLAQDAGDKPICEVVMSAAQSARLAAILHVYLYEKATRKPS